MKKKIKNSSKNDYDYINAIRISFSNKTKSCEIYLV